MKDEKPGGNLPQSVGGCKEDRPSGQHFESDWLNYLQLELQSAVTLYQHAELQNISIPGAGGAIRACSVC